MDRLPQTYNADAAWTRQPCDTEPRWRAFQVYRDMDLPRSLKRVSAAVGTSQRIIEKWSAEDGWLARVFEYDRWIDRIRVDVMLDVMNEDARERGARHVTLLRTMQDAAALAARAWLAKFANDPQAATEWSPNEIARMVKTAITLERLVHGESTENVDNKHGFDLSRLTIDEIETMRALEAKAGG